VLLRALVAAAIGGVLVLGVTGWEWHQTRDRPAEHTVVVSASPAGGQERCGKHSHRDKLSVTRRSADPPRGLPAVFTDIEACDVPTVGDRETVVRVPRGAQDPKVYVDPVQSLGAVVGVTLALAGVVFAVAVVLLSAAELWRRRTPA
jgi:hypothetical protein